MKISDFEAPFIQKEARASDFGIMPGKEIPATLLQQAIDACKAKQINRLIFEPATYNIYIEKSIILEDMDHFEISGNGAMFRFFSPITHLNTILYFKMLNCSHIKFSNLFIDWDWERAPLASLVQVEKRTEDFVDFRYMEDRNLPDTSLFITLNQVNNETFTPGVENGTEYIGPKRFSEEPFLKREKIEDKLYRCYLDKSTLDDRYFRVGSYYLVRHFVYNGGCFSIVDTNHFIFENVTVYSVPGFGVHISGHSHHILFDRFKITLPDFEKRYISATVDGVHVTRSNGYILFENCDLGYQGDDCINIHVWVEMGVEKLSSNTFKYKNTKYSSDRVGEKLEFRNSDLSPTGFSATITEIFEQDGYSVVKLDKEIPDTILPDSVIFNRSYDSGNYEIRNSYFHETRARGILAQADNGIIENCTFYRIQGAAIQIETGASRLWSEGMGVENLTIRNNKIKECDINDWDKGVLYMSTFLPAGIPIQNTKHPNPTTTVGDSGADFRTAYPMFKNITIESNVFEEYPRRAMILTSFDGVHLKNNTFINNVSRDYNNPERGSIWAALGKNLTAENNTFVESPYMMMPGIENDM